MLVTEFAGLRLRIHHMLGVSSINMLTVLLIVFVNFIDRHLYLDTWLTKIMHGTFSLVTGK